MWSVFCHPQCSFRILPSVICLPQFVLIFPSAFSVICNFPSAFCHRQFVFCSLSLFLHPHSVSSAIFLPHVYIHIQCHSYFVIHIIPFLFFCPHFVIFNLPSAFFVLILTSSIWSAFYKDLSNFLVCIMIQWLTIDDYVDYHAGLFMRPFPKWRKSPGNEVADRLHICSHIFILTPTFWGTFSEFKAKVKKTRSDYCAPLINARNQWHIDLAKLKSGAPDINKLTWFALRDPTENQSLGSLGNFKKRVTSMSLELEPSIMVTWYWSAHNLIWQVSIDHNMMSYWSELRNDSNYIFEGVV